MCSFSVKGADSADFSVNIKSFELVVVFAQLKKNVYNALETKLASDKLEIPVIRTIVAIHNLNANQTPRLIMMCLWDRKLWYQKESTLLLWI